MKIMESYKRINLFSLFAPWQSSLMCVCVIVDMQTSKGHSSLVRGEVDPECDAAGMNGCVAV